MPYRNVGSAVTRPIYVPGVSEFTPQEKPVVSSKILARVLNQIVRTHLPTHVFEPLRLKGLPPYLSSRMTPEFVAKNVARIQEWIKTIPYSKRVLVEITNVLAEAGYKSHIKKSDFLIDRTTKQTQTRVAEPKHSEAAKMLRKLSAFAYGDATCAPKSVLDRIDELAIKDQKWLKEFFHRIPTLAMQRGTGLVDIAALRQAITVVMPCLEQMIEIPEFRAQCTKQLFSNGLETCGDGIALIVTRMLTYKKLYETPHDLNAFEKAVNQTAKMEKALAATGQLLLEMRHYRIDFFKAVHADELEHSPKKAELEEAIHGVLGFDSLDEARKKECLSRIQNLGASPELCRDFSNLLTYFAKQDPVEYHLKILESIFPMPPELKLKFLDHAGDIPETLLHLTKETASKLESQDIFNAMSTLFSDGTLTYVLLSRAEAKTFFEYLKGNLGISREACVLPVKDTDTHISLQQVLQPIQDYFTEQLESENCDYDKIAASREKIFLYCSKGLGVLKRNRDHNSS